MVSQEEGAAELGAFLEGRCELVRFGVEGEEALVGGIFVVFHWIVCGATFALSFSYGLEGVELLDGLLPLLDGALQFPRIRIIVVRDLQPCCFLSLRPTSLSVVVSRRC